MGTIEKTSKLFEEQLQVSYSQILTRLKLINEEIIPVEIWLDAEQITKDIDIDDTDFVALTKFLKATLWIGDKVLYNGLRDLKFKKVLNTIEMLATRTFKLRNL